MKKLTAAAMLAATLAVGSIGSAAPASAQGFNFSFDVGDVRFAYRDGYWDNHHRWHKWHNAAEARAFERMHHDRWNNSYHYRVRNSGWRDNDRDGVPNRYDRHPENPTRN
jgi:hypothetical protein